MHTTCTCTPARERERRNTCIYSERKKEGERGRMIAGLLLVARERKGRGAGPTTERGSRQVKISGRGKTDMRERKGRQGIYRRFVERVISLQERYR